MTFDVTNLTPHIVAYRASCQKWADRLSYVAYDDLPRWRSLPEQVHPMAWTHQSGRRSLLLSRTTLVGEEPIG